MTSTLSRLLLFATREHWATGHFNASESDQMRAIVEAAREVGAPAVIGTSEGEAKHLGYGVAVGIRDGLRREFPSIPIFLNADHHKSMDTVRRAIDAGYDSVHIDLSALPFDENVKGTKAVVEYARENHDREVSVEGELGYLRGESKVHREKIEIQPDDYTDPEEAKRFVELTGVHRLAIAVGNIHGISLDEPALDIGRISAIRQVIPEEVSLVLHAGSGIPDDEIRAAIQAGIATIHINTDIRVAFSGELRRSVTARRDEVAMYKLDAPALDAMKKVIIEKLLLFGARINA